MVHFTSVQILRPKPLVREAYISVMSDIVSSHSKRREHLAMHFNSKSCQLCVNIIESDHLNIVTCDSH